jgi:hypothetical protein
MWLLLALLLVLSGVACDTEQPTDAGEQIVSVSVTGNGTVEKWDVWEEWSDADGDCDPDPNGFRTLECLPANDTLSTTVPWRYSAEISVIRAGSTVEEVVATSLGTADEFSSLSFYDDLGAIEPVSNRCPGDPGTVWVRGNRYSASQGRTESLMDKSIMELCLGYSEPLLKEANVLGQVDKFDVVVRQGDTVVFRARKGRDGTLESNPYDAVAIGAVDQTALMFVDGLEVEPLGDAATGDADGGGISISFRIR